MATTKTIVREHEADLVVREVQTAADGVVALTLARAGRGRAAGRGRPARTST